jgi:hypothetical protein
MYGILTLGLTLELKKISLSGRYSPGYAGVLAINQRLVYRLIRQR